MGKDDYTSRSILDIFTETPEDEQWTILHQFTYPANIRRRLDKAGVLDPSEELIESVSGSIFQASEYYRAAKSASLQIAPLLLYYGTTNLFAAVSALTLHSWPKIQGHGLSFEDPDSKLMKDIRLTPRHPDHGALSLFAQVFCTDVDMCSTGQWTVGELLSWIPDIRGDFLDCYESEISRLIPVQIIDLDGRLLDRIERSDMEQFGEGSVAVISHINNYNLEYLQPQYPQNSTHIVLNRKVTGKDIGVYSLSGKKHLQTAIMKNGQSVALTTPIVMFMCLFALGYMCRYRPDRWNAFVRNDTTGERLLVERLLFYCRRRLPNFALDELFGKEVRFVRETERVTKHSQALTERSVRELIRNEIRRQQGMLR